MNCYKNLLIFKKNDILLTTFLTFAKKKVIFKVFDRQLKN